MNSWDEVHFLLRFLKTLSLVVVRICMLWVRMNSRLTGKEECLVLYSSCTSWVKRRLLQPTTLHIEFMLTLGSVSVFFKRFDYGLWFILRINSKMKIKVQIKTFLWNVLSPLKIFVLGFIFTIFIGCLLLSLPFSVSREPLRFIDALFTSTSAVCVTGLTVIDYGKDLTFVFSFSRSIGRGGVRYAKEGVMVG